MNTTKMLLAVMLLSPAVLAEQAPDPVPLPKAFGEFYADLGIGISNQNFSRGLASESIGDAVFTFTGSTKGITLDTALFFDNLGENQTGSAELSYAYGLGAADFSVGVSHSDFDIEYESTDVFFELIGNSVWGGTIFWDIVPSFRQRFDLRESRNFSELKFEKFVEVEKYDLLANSYLLLGAGKFFTDNWGLNHIELGSTVSIRFGSRWLIEPSLGVVIPLSELKERTGNSDVEAQVRILFRYRIR